MDSKQPDCLGTMSISSDEEEDCQDSESSKEVVKKPNPPGPTVDQLKIKTEAAGMDHDAIESALKMHTVQLVERSQAKKSLSNSGLSKTEISRRIRQIAAENGDFEIIDFEALGIEKEGYDFSALSHPDYQPDYIHISSPTALPQEIIDLHNVKEDPEGPQRGTDKDGKPLPINRWWRSGNSETPTSPKKRLSNTLVNTSAESDCSDPDSNPKESTKAFTHFFMKPNRRSAAILQLSRLHPEGAIIFHDTSAEEKEKRDRKQLIQRVKKTLNDSTMDDVDHLSDLLDLISENPKSFFAVKELVDTLLKAGVTEATQIVRRIKYDETLQKPIILPQEQEEGESDCLNPKAQAMISAFDCGDTSGDSSKGNKSAGSSKYPNSSISPLKSPTSVGNNLTLMVGMGHPRFASTPRLTGTVGSPNIPQPPGKRFKGNFAGVQKFFEPPADRSPIKPEEYLRKHRVAGEFLAKISNFPIQGRQTVGAWKAQVRQKLIQKPLLHDYHPRYRGKPGFLTRSFAGEVLPGVFRPCGSGLSEAEATKAYLEANGEEPACLMDLNAWTKAKYPPQNVEFDPATHCIECTGYSMDFWAEIQQYELSRNGASLNNPGNIPHCPLDPVTTDQYFKLHHEFLEPLVPYVANTLLTTLSPSFAARRKYMWWSIPLPHYKGDLVLKDALFDHNAMNYMINNSSKVGRCAVCKGLLLTPQHVTFLAYFFPDDLENDMVNASILQLWNSQKIAVCFVHALTDAVFKPGRQLY